MVLFPDDEPYLTILGARPGYRLTTEKHLIYTEVQLIHTEEHFIYTEEHLI